MVTTLTRRYFRFPERVPLYIFVVRTLTLGPGSQTRALASEDARGRFDRTRLARGGEAGACVPSRRKKVLSGQNRPRVDGGWRGRGSGYGRGRICDTTHAGVAPSPRGSGDAVHAEHRSKLCLCSGTGVRCGRRTKPRTTAAVNGVGNEEGRTGVEVVGRGKGPGAPP